MIDVVVLPPDGIFAIFIIMPCLNHELVLFRELYAWHCIHCLLEKGHQLVDFVQVYWVVQVSFSERPLRDAISIGPIVLAERKQTFSG